MKQDRHLGEIYDVPCVVYSCCFIRAGTAPDLTSASKPNHGSPPSLTVSFFSAPARLCEDLTPKHMASKDAGSLVDELLFYIYQL